MPTAATDKRSPLSTPPDVKRLNHIVPAKLYDQVVELSRETRLDITDLVRLGLGLAMIVIREAQQGHKIVVTDAQGMPVKELLLPPGL